MMIVSGESVQPDDPVLPERERFGLSLSVWNTDGAEAESGEPGESPATAPPAPTYRLFGSRIGSGGQGEVHRAVQLSLGRVVAVKRPRRRDDGAASRGFTMHGRRLSFVQEALLAAILDHPNIVPIHDLGMDADGRPLLAMKLVRGGSWGDLIHADSKLSAPEFLGKHLPILATAAKALAFAHSRGIAHRDFNPNQVMVGSFGEVLLADWGLAMVYDTDKLQSALREICQGDPPPGLIDPAAIPSRANAPSPAGTLAFMAPEQFEDNAGLCGPWTDIYLLGSTLYYLLTGAAPRPGAQDLESAKGMAILPPEEHQVPGGVPAELAELARRCMAPQPTRRLDSAAEFARALEDFQTGAGARRESGRIAQSVSDDWRSMQRTAADYGAFDELDRRLSQALALWPGNAQAASLRREISAAWARRALAHGDYALAEAKSNTLEYASRERNELQEAIRRARSAQAAHRRQRVVSLVLLAVLAIGSMGIYLAKRNSDAHAALLSRIHALRLAEEKLGIRIDRVFSLPASFASDEELYAQPLEPSETEAAQLLAEAAAVSKEREAIVALLPGGSAELVSPPSSLLIAEANATLASSNSRESQERALSLYLEARQRNPGSADPLIGAAVAASRLNRLKEASDYAALAFSLRDVSDSQRRHIAMLQAEIGTNDTSQRSGALQFLAADAARRISVWAGLARGTANPQDAHDAAMLAIRLLRLGGMEGTIQHVRLLHHLGHIYKQLGDYARASGSFAESRELLDGLGPQYSATYCLSLAYEASMRVQLNDLVQFLEADLLLQRAEAIADAELPASSNARMLVLEYRINSMMRLGTVDDAGAVLDKLESARRVSHLPSSSFPALNLRARQLWLRMQPREASKEMLERILWLRSQPDNYPMAWAAEFHCGTLGEYATAVKGLEAEGLDVLVGTIAKIGDPASNGTIRLAQNSILAAAKLGAEGSARHAELAASLAWYVHDWGCFDGGDNPAMRKQWSDELQIVLLPLLKARGASLDLPWTESLPWPASPFHPGGDVAERLEAREAALEKMIGVLGADRRAEAAP